jgi:hypothetical protein
MKGFNDLHGSCWWILTLWTGFLFLCLLSLDYIYLQRSEPYSCQLRLLPHTPHVPMSLNRNKRRRSSGISTIREHHLGFCLGWSFIYLFVQHYALPLSPGLAYLMTTCELGSVYSWSKKVPSKWVCCQYAPTWSLLPEALGIGWRMQHLPFGIIALIVPM